MKENSESDQVGRCGFKLQNFAAAVANGEDSDVKVSCVHLLLLAVLTYYSERQYKSQHRKSQSIKQSRRAEGLSLDRSDWQLVYCEYDTNSADGNHK